MFLRLIKYAIKNILRNKFLSLSSVLVLTLLIFFINVLVVMHDVSFKLIENVNSKLTIFLYLKDDFDGTSPEVVDLLNDIEDVSPEINIDFKTKNQVLEDLKEKDNELVRIIEADWESPLPATVYLSKIHIDDYEALNEAIEKKMYILSSSNNKSIRSDYNYTSQYNRILRIISVLKSLQLWLYIIIAIFLFSIAIIIFSVINNFVYYFKDEIYITRLVGWSSSFIYWPFWIQGVIYSVISLLISFFVFIILINNINLVFSTEYYTKFTSENDFFMLFFVEVGVFSTIGLVSWYLSSRKYIVNTGQKIS